MRAYQMMARGLVATMFAHIEESAYSRCKSRGCDVTKRFNNYIVAMLLGVALWSSSASAQALPVPVPIAEGGTRSNTLAVAQAERGSAQLLNAAPSITGNAGTFSVLNALGVAQFGASSHNFITAEGSPAGIGPWIRSAGGDANIPINFAPKGAGSLYVYGSGGITTETIGSGPFQPHRSGGLFTPFLAFSDVLGGIKAGGSDTLALIETSADTMAAGGAGIDGLYVNMNSGGSRETGNRIGIYSNLNFSGGPTNKELKIGDAYSALWAYTTISGNVGGTSGYGNAWGSVWGGITSAQLLSGATNYAGVDGLEVDVGVAAGASAARVHGMSLVLFDHAQAPSPATDAFITISGASNKYGLANGVVFGSNDSQFALDSSASMFAYQPPNGQLGVTVNPVVSYGFNFPQVEFLTAQWLAPGLKIDGTGNHTIGSNTISWSSTGLSIGITGKVGALSGIAAAGSGYAVGQLLLDPHNGLWQVATLNGSAIGTLKMISAPTIASNSPPSNPVALTSGTSGNGAAINLTWTAADTLKLGGSASVTNAGRITAASIKATNYLVGSSAGVSCSGPPTANFTVISGIVTHC